MTSHIEKSVSLSGQIVALAEDGLRGIERTISAWPAEFQAIIWETVADIASRRASQLRQGDCR